MMKSACGYTLLELLYTVVLAGVLLGIGIPSFSATLSNNAMTASTNTIVTAIHAARSEAVKRRSRVTLCPAELVAGNPACKPDGRSLLVFVNADDDASFDTARGDVAVDMQRWIRGNITVVANGLPGYISFATSGFTRAIGGAPLAGNLVFCDSRGDEAARVLSLSATGRPQVRHRDHVAVAPTCL